MPRKSTLELPDINLGDLSVGQRIALFRKSSGLTQSQLASKIGLKQNLVSDYERSKIRPHPEMLARFSLALNVTADQLLGLDSTIPSNSLIKEKNLIRKLHKAIDFEPPRLFRRPYSLRG